MEEQEEVKVENVNNEEHETDTNTEGEDQEAGGGEDDGADGDKTYTQDEVDEKVKVAKKEQDKRWKDRNKKGGNESEEDSKEVDVRYERLELKSEGIKDKKQQDAVLEYISEKKLLGEDIDIETALKSTALKEKLNGMKAKDSVPPPSSRTSNGTNDSFEYYASRIRKGTMKLSDITDPAMKKQLRNGRIFS